MSKSHDAEKRTVTGLKAAIQKPINFLGTDLGKGCIVFSVIMLACLIFLILIIILVETGTVGCTGKTNHYSQVQITKDTFGVTRNGTIVYRYTLKNANHLEVQIITYGATITSIKVPGKDNDVKDIALGYDTLQEYESGKVYFGGVIGRVANRISKAKFSLDGEDYKLYPNDGENTLHGGEKGWHTVVWEAEIIEGGVRLWRISPDGEDGFPGAVSVDINIHLTEDDQIIIKYSANTTGKGTPINLTHHPYFNLAGEGSGDLYEQEFLINADRYTPTDDKLIPTGDIADVTGTVFDLRRATKLGDVISRVNVTGGGYDSNFCINGPTGRKFVGRVRDPQSHRVMEIFSDQPGLQFYVGNFLNLQNAKNGHSYGKHSGFTMETQNYPDAVNQPSFPDSILRPGSTYNQYLWIAFSKMSI